MAPRLLALRVLAPVFAAALLWGCSAPRASVSSESAKAAAPVAALEWRHVSTKDYESTTPGLGYSRRFACDAGWADVFVYDGTYKGWRDGLDDPNLKPVYDAVVKEVERAVGPEGHFRLLDQDRVVIEGRPYLHAKISMQAHGRAVESHVYITAMRRHLLKLRVSLWQPVSDATRACLPLFVAQQAGFVSHDRTMDAAAAVAVPRRLAIRYDPSGPDKRAGALWLAYAIARVDYREKHQMPLPADGVVQPDFGEEVEARRSAVQVYRELRAKESDFRAAYWDDLVRVDDAGYMAEYVWTYFRRSFWGEEEKPAHLAEFAVWRAGRLARHTPETKGQLEVEAGEPLQR